MTLFLLPIARTKAGNIHKHVSVCQTQSSKIHGEVLETCGQSYKQFTLVNYDSRNVIWGIFKSVVNLIKALRS